MSKLQGCPHGSLIARDARAHSMTEYQVEVKYKAASGGMVLEQETFAPVVLGIVSWLIRKLFVNKNLHQILQGPLVEPFRVLANALVVEFVTLIDVIVLSSFEALLSQRP